MGQSWLPHGQLWDQDYHCSARPVLNGGKHSKAHARATAKEKNVTSTNRLRDGLAASRCFHVNPTLEDMACEQAALRLGVRRDIAYLLAPSDRDTFEAMRTRLDPDRFKKFRKTRARFLQREILEESAQVRDSMDRIHADFLHQQELAANMPEPPKEKTFRGTVTFKCGCKRTAAFKVPPDCDYEDDKTKLLYHLRFLAKGENCQSCAPHSVSKVDATMLEM